MIYVTNANWSNYSAKKNGIEKAIEAYRTDNNISESIHSWIDWNKMGFCVKKEPARYKILIQFMDRWGNKFIKEMNFFGESQLI